MSKVIWIDQNVDNSKNPYYAEQLRAIKSIKSLAKISLYIISMCSLLQILEKNYACIDCILRLYVICFGKLDYS